MSGLEALCRTLRELGVRHVFGLPGTQNAELFSMLPDHSVRPIVAANETAAAFMANGYARTSGRIGVLATIPGPGFTYSLPGVAEARLDSVPMLMLVGTPSTRGGRRFQHQRIDQSGIARPLVKDVIEVSAPAHMASAVRGACAAALADEPGPVLLHLNPEALGGNAGESVDTESGAEQAGDPGRRWEAPLIQRVREAEQPVVFAGAGANSAAGSVRALVETLNAPLVTTVSARGIVPEDHPNALGFDPDRGTVAAANELFDHADLVLALGCKLSHNGTAGFNLRLPREKLVHINTDPAALGPNYPADLLVHACAQHVLRVLLEAQIGRSTWSDEEVAGWKERIARPAASPREPTFHGVDDGTPESFFKALRSALPRNGIVVTDAGLHQVLTRRYHSVLAPGGLLTPTDFQSMGFGLPAAIGASLAAPDRPVIAVVGDGGFLFSAMNLLCAVRERIPVVVIVLNDGTMNLIRLQQLAGHGRTAGVEILNPHLDTLAQAMHVGYRRIDGDPESTLRDALAAERPVLVELLVGDSAGIRALRRRGAIRYAIRRTFGQTFIDRIKALIRGRVRR